MELPGNDTVHESVVVVVVVVVVLVGVLLVTEDGIIRAWPPLFVQKLYCHHHRKKEVSDTLHTPYTIQTVLFIIIFCFFRDRKGGDVAKVV